RAPARAGAALGREHRDVPALLRLQGRPGARALVDAPAGGAPTRAMTEQLALTDDLSTASIVAVVVVLVASLALLIVELGRRERYGAWIALSGVLALLLLGAAVLRPVRVATRGSVVGPRVVVLLDQSRRLLLPAGDGTRR